MADELYNKSLISADSHVMEPRRLWQDRIDARWRDKAPRIEALDESGDYIVIEGMRPRAAGVRRPDGRPEGAGNGDSDCERLSL